MVRSFLRILLRLPGLQVPEMVLADRSHPYLTFATQIHTGPADRLHRQRGAYLLHLLGSTRRTGALPTRHWPFTCRSSSTPRRSWGGSWPTGFLTRLACSIDTMAPTTLMLGVTVLCMLAVVNEAGIIAEAIVTGFLTSAPQRRRRRRRPAARVLQGAHRGVRTRP